MLFRSAAQENNLINPKQAAVPIPAAMTSPCSKVRDVTRWGASPGFSISHYITVSDPSGGAGGRGLLILSALSTRRASGDPAEMPDRGFCPSRRNVT